MNNNSKNKAIDGLTQLGLPLGEAKAYVTLVEVGSSEATPLANLSDIPQPRIYSFLKSLEQKGFIYKTHIKGKANLYKPKSYEQVMTNLKQTLEQKINETEDYLKRAEQEQDKEGVKDYITFIQGKKAVEDGLMEIFQNLKKNCLLLDTGYYSDFIDNKIQPRDDLIIERPLHELKMDIEQIEPLKSLFESDLFEPLQLYRPLIMFNDVDKEQKTCESIVIVGHPIEDEDPIIVEINHEVITNFQIRLILIFIDIIKQLPDLL